MADDTQIHSAATNLLVEVLKAQPDLVKTNKIGTEGGKQAGDFITALHSSLRELYRSRPA